MRDGPGLWLALLGVALGHGAGTVRAEPGPAAQDDDLLALLEFLGDEETASDIWNGFFDSLPERLEDPVPSATGPVAAEEDTP